MRLLLLSLVVLTLAVAVGNVLLSDPGLVVLSHGDWMLRTSLSVFVILLLLAVVILFLLLRALVAAWALPHRLGRWVQARRQRRAQDGLARGFLSLAEGNWDRAERLLADSAADSRMPLVHYLAAAQAAQQQNALDRRDRYLSLAHANRPDADLAVGLTQAELQMRGRQWDQALVTLSHLRNVSPRHAQVLKLLAQLYQEAGEWQHLQALLPELRRCKAYSAEDADALEARVWLGLLERAAEDADSEALVRFWSGLARRQRRDPRLVEAYCARLLGRGQGEQAEPLLRKTLERSWDPGLVRLYGRLEGGDAIAQLARAERWLAERPEDPDLLLSVGRLSLRSGLWGKARSYLQTCIAVAPTPEGYRLLAEALDHMGDSAGASACFRRGLQLAAGGERSLLPAKA